MDTDSSGDITYEELNQALLPRHQAPALSSLPHAVWHSSHAPHMLPPTQMDTDSSGDITYEELKRFFLAIKHRYSCTRAMAVEILARK